MTVLLRLQVLLVFVGIACAKCPSMASNIHRKSLVTWSGEDVASVIGSRLRGNDTNFVCENILEKNVTGYDVALRNDWTYWAEIAPGATDPHPKRVTRWFRTRFANSMISANRSRVDRFQPSLPSAEVPEKKEIAAEIPAKAKKNETKSSHFPKEKKDNSPVEKKKDDSSGQEEKKATAVSTKTTKKHKKKKKKAWISKRLVDREKLAYLTREDWLVLCKALPSVCDMPNGRFKLSMASCVLMSKESGLMRFLVSTSVLVLCWRRRKKNPQQRQGLTMRIFVAALMIVETWSLAAPELNAFATPELISLHPRFPSDDGVVPPLVQWILPSLSPTTRLYYFRRLKLIRLLCVASWSAFVATRQDEFYAVGALAYSLLNTISLAYNKGHSTQGVILFVFSACLSVGDFDDPWLLRFLIYQVLVPIYLFSGISKIRYLGLADNFLTGDWLKEAMKWSRTNQAFPRLTSLAKAFPCFMSISNQFIETIQPLLVLFFDGHRGLMLAAALAFHISVFILLGPNFIKLILLLVFAADPLASFSTTTLDEKKMETQQTKKKNPLRSRIQAVYGALVVFGWLRVQFITDYLHLSGQLKYDERHNPYFPFPELSMFAIPQHRDTQNYRVAAFMDIAIAIGYAFKEVAYWRSL